jgi:hypothetical protein
MRAPDNGAFGVRPRSSADYQDGLENKEKGADNLARPK